MSVYHGWRTLDSTESHDTRGWRVDFRGHNGGRGNTARAIIRCPWDGSEHMTDNRGRTRTVTRMVAGYNVNDPSNDIWPDDTWDGIGGFRRFTELLYRQGYLSTAGFQPILAPADPRNTNRYGEMMPGPYEFQRPDDENAGCKFRWMSMHLEELTLTTLIQTDTIFALQTSIKAKTLGMRNTIGTFQCLSATLTNTNTLLHRIYSIDLLRPVQLTHSHRRLLRHHHRSTQTHHRLLHHHHHRSAQSTETTRLSLIPIRAPLSPTRPSRTLYEI